MNDAKPFRAYIPGLSGASSAVFAAAAILVAAAPARSQSVETIFPPSPIKLPPSPAPAVLADFEGYGVAGSSRLIVVGRPGREVSKNGTVVNGAGQVVVWDVEEGYLKRSWTIDAPNPQPGYYFGGAVAAGDRWIAVSHGPSRVGVSSSGGVTKTNRVQLIEFPPDGDWKLGPDLSPSGEDAGFRASGHAFGQALVMKDNRLIVSAGGSIPGAVFVYDVNEAGTWTRTQRIDGPFPAREAGFGQAIALAGDLLLVGVPASLGGNGSDLLQGQGGAYVYRKGSNGLYSLEKEFRAPDGAASDLFGKAVSVDILPGVEIVAIGAPLAEIAEPGHLYGNAGAVYLFERPLPNGEWAMVTKLTRFGPGEPSTDNQSGLPLSLGHGRLYVASDGFAYLFDRLPAPIGWKLNNATSRRVYNFQNGALASFERGFLIGSGNNTLPGTWDWLLRYPYDGLVNQPGAWPGGTSSTERRADADPDGDGIPNGEELFFGTLPLVANANRILEPTRDLVAKQFRLRWQEAAETYGLTSRLSWAGSAAAAAANWTTNGIQILSLGVVPGSTQRAFEARLPFAGNTNVFFRFEVR
jgi:hypothetical protein